MDEPAATIAVTRPPSEHDHVERAICGHVSQRLYTPRAQFDPEVEWRQAGWTEMAGNFFILPESFLVNLIVRLRVYEEPYLVLVLVPVSQNDL